MGLYVGLFFLASLWLCARWMGRRAPILSIALLGCLPAFIFIVGANRAYGLASGLLVLSFGTIWRVVELPSRSRILWAGLTCFLFAQCVYYDVVFLAAMLAGGALVVIRRRQWKTLVTLVGIGAVSAGSLVIYQPIIHQGSAHLSLAQLPFFSLSILWDRFGDAVTARSSGEAGYNGPEAWLWVMLVLSGSVVALVTQRMGRRRQNDEDTAGVVTVRADLALFCAVSMVFGVLGYFAFLVRLQYWTQSWYYVEILCLCAISLDGLFGASWPSLRPWGLLRIGFLMVLMAWGAKSAWEEAHTRRSDVDLIARVLNKNASAGDLIVVQGAWEAITFDRYYHGRARWMTVPPLDTHKVHRTDLIWERLDQQLKGQEPMTPVLQAITNTLQAGNQVWLVGNMNPARPKPSLSTDGSVEWYGPYLAYWSGQITSQLMNHALQSHFIDIPTTEPICLLEDIPLSEFSGFRPGAK